MTPLADIPGDPQTLRNPRHWGIPWMIPGGYRGRSLGACLRGIPCGISWVITRESRIPQGISWATPWVPRSPIVPGVARDHTRTTYSRRDLIWFPMIPYDFIWFQMISYDLLWFLMISFDFLWCPMISYGFIWFHNDFIWFIWFDTISYDFMIPMISHAS